MAVTVTVKTPKTDPRIIITSEYGTAEIRPAELWASEALMVAVHTTGSVDVEEYDAATPAPKEQR